MKEVGERKKTTTKEVKNQSRVKTGKLGEGGIRREKSLVNVLGLKKKATEQQRSTRYFTSPGKKRGVRGKQKNV